MVPVMKPFSAGVPGDVFTLAESIFHVVGTSATAFTAVGFWIDLIKFMELLDAFTVLAC
jgi:hypothetical protein